MSSTKPALGAEQEAGSAGAAPIVVGCDGSKEGRDALELARVLAAVRGARCIVATVPERGPARPRGATGDAAESEPLFEEARGALAGFEVETRVLERGSAGRVLAELARAESASALVVGAPHHRSSAARMLLGSVAEHLLHHAPCEVAIAPRGYADTTLSHSGLDEVTVAFDGTEESWNALRHAEALAAAAGATIQVLVAKDPLVEGLEAETRPDQAGNGEAILDRAVNSVRDSLRVSGKVLRPAGRETVTTVAAALAEACAGELLVCGSRPAPERILLASVTKRVIEMSVHPVLVVPAAAAE